MKKCIITVVGKDSVGIIAKVAKRDQVSAVIEV